MDSSHMLPEFKVEYMKPTKNKRRTLNMGEIIVQIYKLVGASKETVTG